MGQPGVAKTRPRKYRHEAHDGHEHVEARWGEPRCTQCGELAAWANDTRALSEGWMRDGRWARKAPLPVRILQLNGPLVRELDQAIAMSALHHTARRLIRLYLRYVDWHTGVVYRNPTHLALFADVGERQSRLILSGASSAGLIRRSSSRSRAGSDVPHLHYDAHDDRLRGPNPDAIWDPRFGPEEWHERRYGFWEWRIGVRWTEWMPMSVATLKTGIEALIDELGRAWSRRERSRRRCEIDPRGTDRIDPRGTDRSDPPFHRRESLSLDPLSGSSPSPSSSPSQGADAPSAPESSTPTAGGAESPSATGDGLVDREPPPPFPLATDERAVEGGINNRTNVVNPEPTSCEEPASAEAAPSALDVANRIALHWRSRFDPDRSGRPITDEARSPVISALAFGRTEDELREAIDEAAVSPHNRADPARCTLRAILKPSALEGLLAAAAVRRKLAAVAPRERVSEIRAKPSAPPERPATPEEIAAITSAFLDPNRTKEPT